jgi:hypothetical protein
MVITVPDAPVDELVPEVFDPEQPPIKAEQVKTTAA